MTRLAREVATHWHACWHLARHHPGKRAVLLGMPSAVCGGARSGASTALAKLA